MWVRIADTDPLWFVGGLLRRLRPAVGDAWFSPRLSPAVGGSHRMAIGVLNMPNCRPWMTKARGGKSFSADDLKSYRFGSVNLFLLRPRLLLIELSEGTSRRLCPETKGRCVGRIILPCFAEYILKSGSPWRSISQLYHRRRNQSGDVDSHILFYRPSSIPQPIHHSSGYTFGLSILSRPATTHLFPTWLRLSSPPIRCSWISAATRSVCWSASSLPLLASSMA